MGFCFSFSGCQSPLPCLYHWLSNFLFSPQSVLLRAQWGLLEKNLSQCEFTLCLKFSGLLLFYDSPHWAFSGLLKFCLMPFYVCIGSLSLPPVLYYSWDWLSILSLPTCKLILLGFQGIWLLHSFKGSCLQEKLWDFGLSSHFLLFE